MSTTDFLRPSILPKVAVCGHYRPEAEAGAEAARGTKVDVIFRDVIAGAPMPTGEMMADEIEAVTWAVDRARALAGGLPLFSSEEALRIECLGMTGTADLLCEEGGWSADLKSGQVRNYQEQQAAYALGFMEQFFADEWTVYLLFCDQRIVDTLRFTREEAERIVRAAIASARHPGPATPNEYCGWCAKRWECEARREAIGIIPLEGPQAVALEAQPSDKLREFVLRAGVLDDFVEKAREILKERVQAGEKVAGVSVVAKRGARKVPANIVEQHLAKLGTMDVLAAYGAISEDKLRAIWERKLPLSKFPEEAVEEFPGSNYVRVSRPKQAKV